MYSDVSIDCFHFYCHSVDCFQYPQMNFSTIAHMNGIKSSLIPDYWGWKPLHWRFSVIYLQAWEYVHALNLSPSSLLTFEQGLWYHRKRANHSCQRWKAQASNRHSTRRYCPTPRCSIPWGSWHRSQTCPHNPARKYRVSISRPNIASHCSAGVVGSRRERHQVRPPW